MREPQLRLVTDPDDPAIARFGQLQNRAYYDPGMLIPASYMGHMLTENSPQRRNFLLVAEHEGAVVGGSVFHLLASVNVGFSSFLAVAHAARGRGLARRLHQERLRALDGAAGREVEGVFIDVVNPERLSPQERQAEARVGSDPTSRRLTFRQLGFRQIDIRYEQPVGGPDGGPVTNMDLLFCPHRPRDHVPTELVARTMQAYWTPWLGAQRARHHADELARRAAGRAELPLIDPVPDA